MNDTKTEVYHDEPPSIELRQGNHNGHHVEEEQTFERCWPVMIHCRSKAEAKAVAQMVSEIYTEEVED